MKYIKLVILISILFLISYCKKDDSGQYTDKLTFGTSINYADFTLSGEGTIFSTVPGNVAYRLESEEDFNGNPVKFVVKKDGVTYSTEVFSNNPKPTGHIFMTVLNYAQKGNYSVTAYIQKTGGDKMVASGAFQMN